MSKVYVFRRSKEMSKDQVLDQLGLGGGFAGGWRVGGGMQGGGVVNAGVTRFLLSASEEAYVIHSLLEELGTDQWPVAPGNRSLRCTGVALSVAAGLLGACLPGTGVRIVALVGGPVPKALDRLYPKIYRTRFVHIKIWTRTQHRILGRLFSFTRNSQSRWSTRVMSWTFLLLPFTSEYVNNFVVAAMGGGGGGGSGDDGGGVVEEKRKVSVRLRRKPTAMNTTKHLWAGAVAAMVSRFVYL